MAIKTRDELLLEFNNAVRSNGRNSKTTIQDLCISLPAIIADLLS